MFFASPFILLHSVFASDSLTDALESGSYLPAKGFLIVK